VEMVKSRFADPFNLGNHRFIRHRSQSLNDSRILAGDSVNDVSVTLGGQPVTVLGTALIPGLAGLYQIAIQLPSNLESGDYEVITTLNGVQSPSNVLISVRK
jgi:uncharacterized protein (TIGR03437 family)